MPFCGRDYCLTVGIAAALVIFRVLFPRYELQVSQIQQGKQPAILILDRWTGTVTAHIVLLILASPTSTPVARSRLVWQRPNHLPIGPR